MEDTKPPVETDKPPSRTELLNKINTFIEEESAPIVKTPVKTEAKESEQKVEVAPVEAEDAPTEPEAPKAPKNEMKVDPDIDYKQKFVASTREAQRLHATNAKIHDVIEQANQLAAPVDEELKKEYPDWDVMSDLEKRLAKNDLTWKKRFELLDGVVKDSADYHKWDEAVDTFADDPATLNMYSDLEGKTDEFKEFASKKENRNANMSLLVSSFLWEQQKKKPKHKGEMFPTGSGGANEKPKITPSKLSFDDSAALRDTNYEEYKRQLRAGRIQMDPD